MKDKLHKLCIRLGWYREIYNGHFDFGRTFVGTYFIIGDYLPLTLQRCIELERGYHQESYMEMEHDVHKASSKLLIGAAALGAAFATSCDEAIKEEKITSPAPPIQRFDPPHS